MAKWSTEDITRLREGYAGRERCASIGAAVGRSAKMVRYKAHCLGISRAQRWKKIRPHTRAALTRIRKLHTAELAYIAGIIDGEGSIRCKSATEAWLIQVGNTHLGVLEWLRDTIGGAIYGPIQKDNPRWKPYWLWALGSEALVIRLLRRCMPYLIIKRDRALEALAALDPTLPAHQYGGHSRRRPG